MRNGAPTREKIDRVAMELFVEKGVTETTTRDIAAAAGIAEGTIYRHYKSKDALVAHLFQTHYESFAFALEELQAAHSGIKDKLRAIVDRFCDLFDEDRTLFAFLMITQHQQLRRLESGRPTPVAALKRVIAGAIDSGEIPNQDTDLATAMVLGILLQPAVFSMYERLGSKNMASVSEEITAAACRAISAT